MKKLAVLLCAGFCILFLQPDLVRGARLSGEDAPVSVSGTQQIEKVEQKSDQEAQKIQNSDEPQPKKKIKPKTKKAVKPAKKKKAAGNGNTKAPRKGTENFVTIDFDNVDIAVFIKAIGEMTGKNFVIDNQVKGNVTVYSPKKVSVTEAYKVFESVLEVHGFTAVASGDVIKIIPAKDAKEKSIETRLKNEAVGPEDKIVTQIVSLNHANPDDMKRILDPLISRSSIILSYPQTGMLVITDVLSNIKRLLKIIGALDVPGSGEQIASEECQCPGYRESFDICFSG